MSIEKSSIIVDSSRRCVEWKVDHVSALFDTLTVRMREVVMKTQIAYYEVLSHLFKVFEINISQFEKVEQRLNSQP